MLKTWRWCGFCRRTRLHCCWGIGCLGFTMELESAYFCLHDLISCAGERGSYTWFIVVLCALQAWVQLLYSTIHLGEAVSSSSGFRAAYKRWQRTSDPLVYTKIGRLLSSMMSTATLCLSENLPCFDLVRFGHKCM